MADDKDLEAGDRVSWKSQGKRVDGKVVKKLTKPIDIESHHVAASPEHPEFLVESEKTGRKAAHTPAALRKKR